MPSRADRADAIRAEQDEAVFAFCGEMTSALEAVGKHLIEVAKVKGQREDSLRTLALASLELERALDAFDRHREKLLHWR